MAIESQKHKAAQLDRMGTRLAITIDTEEEGLWGGKYRPHDNQTENLRGLPRFQNFCESLGVIPTYLIDAPVLENTAAIQWLKTWWEEGLCEVGSHCHPWCNPPFFPNNSTDSDSYLCNLPEYQQREKLVWLTERIERVFDRRPRSYRAGRYGFDATSAKILSELSYTVDSSLLPMFNYQEQGGPDFTMANPQPHRLPNTSNQLLELPITSGFTNGVYENQRSRWQKIRKSPWRELKIPGIADRMNFVRRVKLSPEGTRIDDLKQLVDSSILQGRNQLVLMLHSTSLVEGYSPYSKNSEMLKDLYERLVSIIRYTITKHKAQPTTLETVANLLN